MGSGSLGTGSAQTVAQQECQLSLGPTQQTGKGSGQLRPQRAPGLFLRVLGTGPEVTRAPALAARCCPLTCSHMLCRFQPGRPHLVLPPA